MQKGRRADLNNRKDPQQTFALNSVVDSRSVFVQLKILDKMVEAVCDCGASVSCLRSEIYNELKKTYQTTLENCTRSLRAANGLPIDVKVIIRVPVYVGNKLFHHEFRVLEKSEADCLLRLDFLERHKYDPLFSRMELKLDSTHSVPLITKTLNLITMLSLESLRPKPLKYQQATQQFFQHTSQTGRDHVST